MTEDKIAQLNLFSALAMHALINRATTMPTDTRDIAVRSVDIAESLIKEITAAQSKR